MGYIRIAFILSFYFLQGYDKSEGYYFRCIQETIKQGGDTDTNACIVGAMIGALVGLKELPQHMLTKVVRFDCTKKGQRRPEWLSVRRTGL